MNNKPYGWVKNGEYVLYIDKPDSVFNYTPLYTHLVKELTDEDILKMASDYLHYTEFKQGIQFARAILKKASEK